VRCPACGARNSDHADWCTQCYADLRGPVPAAETELEPAPPGGVATPDLRGRGGRHPDATARDVRTVDGGVEWRCATCGGWTPLGAPRCGTCDAPRQGFGDSTPPPAVDRGARGRLVLASALLPGLGHLLTGRTGTGAARLILAVSWLLGAVAVLRSAGQVLPAAPLLLGVAVIWAGSLRDVLALVDGGPELLTSRVLLWLTAGVILALLVTLVVAVGGPA
jgi:hypothetical protein